MANFINFNQDADKNKQEQPGSSGNLLQNGGGSADISPVSAFNAQQSVPGGQAQPGKPASSGQFTNIQKYLGANQGAGQQVAGGVSGQMNKSLRPGEIKQEDATKAFASSVQSANDVLGRGQQYNQQLQAPVQQTQGILGSAAAPNAPGTTTNAFGDQSHGPAMNQQQAMAATGQGGVQPVNAQQAAPQAFDPGSFVNDQNKLTDYTKIRLGQGINEEQLGNQANQAQTLAGLNQETANSLNDQSKTAQGRAGLVAQAFNRPTYTQGQQRLDNLFLTGAGKQGIGAVQQTGQQNVGRMNDIYGQAQQGVTQAGQLKTQESDLQSSLQNRANALEQGYVQNLESLIPQVNNMRGDERARWQKNYDILTGKTKGQIDQDIFNELQLRSGEHAFGVLKDPNLSIGQVAQLSERNAANIQDVAGQKDVDYYNMLAKLSKGTLDAQGNFAGPASDQLQLSKASDLGRAAQALTGDSSLRNRLNEAQNKFFTDALTRTISGVGEDTGSSGMFGGGGTATSQMNINLGEYLKSLGLDSAEAYSPGATHQNYAQMATDVANLANPVGLAGTAAAALMPNNAIGQLGGMIAGAPGQIAGGLASAAGLTGSGGSSVAANARARQALLDNLTSTLKGANFNEYVTTGGRVNADALAQQSRNIESNRLSSRNDNQFYTNQLNTPQQQEQYARNEQARQLLNMTGYNPSDVKSSYTAEDITKLQNRYADYATNYNTGNGGWYQGQLIERMDPTAKQAWRDQVIGTTNNLGTDAVKGILAGRNATETKYNQQQEANAQALRELLGTKDIQTGAIAESPAMTREQVDRLLAGRK